MTSKTIAFGIIAVSLLFALLILGVDRYTEGTSYNLTAKYLLVALWFVPFVMLTNRRPVEDSHETKPSR